MLDPFVFLLLFFNIFLTVFFFFFGGGGSLSFFFQGVGFLVRTLRRQRAITDTCRDKHVFVATKICLSRQKYACCDKSVRRDKNDTCGSSHQ